MSIFNCFSFLISALSMKDRRRHVLCKFITQKRYFFQRRVKNQLIAVDDQLKNEEIKIQIIQSQIQIVHEIVKKLSRRIR